MTPQLDRRSFLKAMGIVTAAAACGGGGTGAPAPATATGAAPTAAAKPSGRISVYSALNESTNNQFVAALNAATNWLLVDSLGAE